MKTTVDIPEELLERAKIAAARRRTTLRELVVTGLDSILRTAGSNPNRDAALARLKKGLHLGAKPLTRGELHERG